MLPIVIWCVTTAQGADDGDTPERADWRTYLDAWNQTHRQGLEAFEIDDEADPRLRGIAMVLGSHFNKNNAVLNLLLERKSVQDFNVARDAVNHIHFVSAEAMKLGGEEETLRAWAKKQPGVDTTRLDELRTNLASQMSEASESGQAVRIWPAPYTAEGGLSPDTGSFIYMKLLTPEHGFALHLAQNGYKHISFKYGFDKSWQAGAWVRGAARAIAAYYIQFDPDAVLDSSIVAPPATKGRSRLQQARERTMKRNKMLEYSYGRHIEASYKFLNEYNKLERQRQEHEHRQAEEAQQNVSAKNKRKKERRRAEFRRAAAAANAAADDVDTLDMSAEIPESPDQPQRATADHPAELNSLPTLLACGAPTFNAKPSKYALPPPPPSTISIDRYGFLTVWDEKVEGVREAATARRCRSCPVTARGI